MKPWEFLEEYYEKKKLEVQLPQQETFVSDEHISDISKMVELPQQEISDEEIEKAANGHFEGDLMWSERIAFKLAIRWYREQLKTKSCS